jgi:hypothetical protein
MTFIISFPTTSYDPTNATIENLNSHSPGP